MNGGKVLWLIDGTDAIMDSLERRSAFLSMALDLNLDDQLFKYGVRVNPNLIMDLRSTRIPIITGYIEDAPQFEPKPWYYFPLVVSESL